MAQAPTQDQYSLKGPSTLHKDLNSIANPYLTPTINKDRPNFDGGPPLDNSTICLLALLSTLPLFFRRFLYTFLYFDLAPLDLGC